MITLDEIMITEVLTLHPEDSIYKATALMTENNIRHIPILDQHQKLVGMVSHRDILRARNSNLESSKNEPQDSIENTPLKAIMSKQVKTASPADSLRSVGLTLQKEKFGCVPVVNNDVLVGIVTDTDFVSAALVMMEGMEQYESDDELYDDNPEELQEFDSHAEDDMEITLQ